MSKYLALVVFAVLLSSGCGGSPIATLSVVGSPSTSLSAASISFGSQVVGTASTGEAITLSNTGSAALHIGGIAVALPFTETHTYGSSLGAGATCSERTDGGRMPRHELRYTQLGTAQCSEETAVVSTNTGLPRIADIVCFSHV